MLDFQESPAAFHRVALFGKHRPLATKSVGGDKFESVTSSMLLWGYKVVPRQIDPVVLDQLKSEPPKSRAV